MEETATAQFWTPRRVLTYTLIIALVLFVVYKQSLVVFVLERVAHVLVTLLLGVALAYLLNPVVGRVTRWLHWGGERGRRTLAALLTVLGFLALVIGLAVLTAVPIVSELRDLGVLLQEWARNLPRYLDQWLQAYARVVPPGLADTIESQASALAGVLLRADYFTAFKWVATRGWYVVELLLIPVVGFHLLRDGRALRLGMLAYVSPRHRPVVSALSDDVHRVLKSYVRGILILCLFFGITTTLLLYFAGTRIYLTLGLLAGLSWTIPIVGPVVAGIFVVGVTLLQSGLEAALAVLAIYIGLNIVDSKLITPFVLGEALRLHPITVITALLLTGQLLGPVGMLIAVPLVAIFKAAYVRYQKIQASAEVAG